MRYSQMTTAELEKELVSLESAYNDFKSRGLLLDMSRGKPSEEQIKITLPLLDAVDSKSNLKSEDGINCLNYGCPDGLPECKRLIAGMLETDESKIILGGNSSLNMMFDYISQCMLKGSGAEPWIKQGNVKFICPVPGYDRHFRICEYLGIEMINVPFDKDGPDMDIVEELVKDNSVKGMFCIPKYSNPTGISYSDKTIKRLVSMKTADDFRIIWDNAYCVHDLFGKHDDILEVLSEAEKAGNPDRVVEFASTSKISFSGSGIAAIAVNKGNFKLVEERMGTQTIGHDKVNQLRHADYFKDINGIKKHMKVLSDIISPKFSQVLNDFERELGPCDIAEWTKPNGGYFISLDVMDGCATRVYNLCKDGGVKLTNVGATFPYEKDPNDKNIRIAPTYPSIDELELATELLCVCVRIASVEKLLNK